MGRLVMAEPLHRPQARRSFLGIAAAAGLTLTLAACQLVPSRQPVRPPPPEPIEEPEPPLTGLPADETRNRVAVLVPLSGDNAGVGRSIANAANLALLDTGGQRIRITIYDTARGAAAAANEALAQGNGLFLGPLLAEDVEAVAPIARRARVPIISFSNDVTVGGNGVYVMGFNPRQSIERVVGYSRSRGLLRFAGLAPTGDYGQRSGRALRDAVAAAGGRLVGMQTYDRRPQSVRSAVNRLNAETGYDAVLIADNARVAAQAAPAIRGGASGQARILGTELWKTEANLGSQAALRGAWFAGVADARFGQLRTRYRARYGVNPYRLASLGYDAVLLTVRIARDWRIGRAFPEHLIRSEEGFTGVDGAFRFGRDGIADRALEVQQINAGGVVTVSPAPANFSR
jgi:ABC-type branched-subunit amino acid transport system substrate-binding protein